MHPAALSDLVTRAKADPAFYHALVFDTKQALASLPSLGVGSLAPFSAIDPESFFSMAGDETERKCNPTCNSSCDSTCGSNSCDRTCGADSCSNTCGERSCSRTQGFPPGGKPLQSV